MNANLTTLVTVAGCLLGALGSTASADSLRAPALARTLEHSVPYELNVLSTATSLKCDASHSFHQTVSVCGPSGCKTTEVTELPEVHFDAVEQGRITIASSSTYSRNGVVYGESQVDQLRTGNTGRFVQTVAGHSGCLKSIAFELRPRTE